MSLLRTAVAVPHAPTMERSRRCVTDVTDVTVPTPGSDPSRPIPCQSAWAVGALGAVIQFQRRSKYSVIVSDRVMPMGRSKGRRGGGVRGRVSVNVWCENNVVDCLRGRFMSPCLRPDRWEPLGSARARGAAVKQASNR